MATGITVDTNDDTIAAPDAPCAVKIVNTGATEILVYIEGIHDGYPTTFQNLDSGLKIAASASEVIRVGTRGLRGDFGRIHFKTATGSSTMDVYKIADGI